jgi:hypothetical protein
MHESSLLERVGIDPKDPRVPEQVAHMAGVIGRHHAKNGVQMIGPL